VYTLTFNDNTIKDLLDHRSEGRQFFGALVIPYSGVFTNRSNGFYTSVPKLLCPYQINDIIIIQEKWASSGSGEYLYETDSASGVSVADYFPAYTMPDEAARMYGRIVSAVPWTITPNIADNFIPSGMNIDSWAGTAKVIDNFQSGNRYLNKIRQRRSKEAWNKTYQPIIRTTDPPTLKYVPYQRTKDSTYRLTFVNEDTNPSWVIMHTKYYTDAAQAYYTYYGTDFDTQRLMSGKPVSQNVYTSGVWSQDAWTTYPTSLTRSEADSLINSGVHLYERGLAYDSPTTSRSNANAKFIYLVLDQQDNPIPVYAYFVTETVDDDQHAFAWLISGYLCEKDGTIIGNAF